jgi:hypothetical protein
MCYLNSVFPAEQMRLLAVLSNEENLFSTLAYEINYLQAGILQVGQVGILKYCRVLLVCWVADPG